MQMISVLLRMDIENEADLFEKENTWKKQIAA